MHWVVWLYHPILEKRCYIIGDSLWGPAAHYSLSRIICFRDAPYMGCVSSSVVTGLTSAESLAPGPVSMWGFCMNPLGAVSLLPINVMASHKQPLWPLKPDILHAHLPGTGPHGWRAHCGSHTPHSLWLSFCLWVVHLGMWFFTASPPFLFISFYFLLHTFKLWKFFSPILSPISSLFSDIVAF